MFCENLDKTCTCDTMHSGDDLSIISKWTMSTFLSWKGGNDTDDECDNLGRKYPHSIYRKIVTVWIKTLSITFMTDVKYIMCAYFI